MKFFKLIFVAGAMLALSTPALAASNPDSANSAGQSIWIGSHGNFSNWRAIGRDELIIWATPSKPYLVKIWRPYTSLRFVQTIGVTSTIGRITKLDSVIVDGQRLPIKSIVPLDRETAKNMRWRSS